MAHIGAIIDLVAGDDWIIRRPVRREMLCDGEDLISAALLIKRDFWSLDLDSLVVRNIDFQDVPGQGWIEAHECGMIAEWLRFDVARDVTTDLFAPRQASFYLVKVRTTWRRVVTMEKGSLITL